MESPGEKSGGPERGLGLATERPESHRPVFETFRNPFDLVEI